MGHHSFLCVVCDATFERDKLAGNFVQLRKLCDSCVVSHKWCSHRMHAPLRSQFSPSNRSNGDGLQWICNVCLPDKRGSYRLRTCGYCSVEFRTGGRGDADTRFNGHTSVHLCDECYVNVKHCKTCDLVKPLDYFYPARDKRNGRKGSCRSCESESWKNATPEKRFRARNYKFGMTRDEYLALVEKQQGCCAICRNPETVLLPSGSTRTLAVDHCHKTGQRRELLCGRCNQALGLMQDDPARLRAAADYVERWAAALSV